MARRARIARDGRRSGGQTIAQMPRRNVRNLCPPMEIFSSDQIKEGGAPPLWAGRVLTAARGPGLA